MNYMKKFRIILVLLVITCACFGGYIFNDYLNAPKIAPEDLIEVFTPGSGNITAETIIKGVNQENKIISTHVSLSCEIKIEEKYFDLNILKKSQVLKFYGTALYTVNLENLAPRDISINEDSVRIYIDKPELYALNLDAEQTVINRVERGLLSFGSIKIAPEDYKNMQATALAKMNDQLNGEDIKILTETNAKQAAADLFCAVLAAISDNSGGNFMLELEFR